MTILAYNSAWVSRIIPTVPVRSDTTSVFRREEMNSQLFKRPHYPLAMIVLAALAAIGAALPRLGAPRAFDALRLPPAVALTVGHAAAGLTGAEAPQAAFERLQSRASGPLSVHWSELTGIPDFLTGA